MIDLREGRDRERAEEALPASEQNFRLIVESIPGFVCTTTAASEIEFVNQRILDYLGKTLEESKDWRRTLLHEDDCERVIETWSRSVVIMQLEATKGAIAQNNLAEATDRVERAGDLARVGLGEARRSVMALRPRSLQDTSLRMALDDLLKRMTNGSGLQAEFHLEGDEPAMAPEWEEGLLRVAQESLTNTIKHAEAKNFRATLIISPNEIQFRLVDDGAGFDLHAEHEGFGLLGMKERVDQMGGQFVLRSRPGQGTEIQVVLNNPIKPKPDDGGEHA